MAGPGDLHALAVALLDVCIESLDTIPDFEPHLDGAPTRAFVSPGQPVFDCCDQLTVHVQQINDADTLPGALNAGHRAKFGKINHVTLIVTSTRCITTGGETRSGGLEIPSAEDLQDDAEQLDADAWALWNHAFNMTQAEEFRTLCDEVFFDGINSIVPSGGCAGWTVTVRVALEGYAETLGS